MLSLLHYADNAAAGEPLPGGEFAWDGVWVYDHFHTTPTPSTEATHEAWTLMAAFAAASQRVRLGQMCTCMAYREPTYLAKVAATVDHVSGAVSRWASARAGTSTSGARTGTASPARASVCARSTRACRSWPACGGPGRRARSRASATRWTAPCATRSRSSGSRSTARAPCRASPVDRRRGREEDPAHRRAARPVHELRRLAGGLRPQVRGARAALPRPRPRLREITRSANYNVVIGETEQDVADRLARVEEHARRYFPRRRTTASRRGGTAPSSGRRSRSSRPSRRCAPRASATRSATSPSPRPTATSSSSSSARSSRPSSSDPRPPAPSTLPSPREQVVLVRPVEGRTRIACSSGVDRMVDADHRECGAERRPQIATTRLRWRRTTRCDRLMHARTAVPAELLRIASRQSGLVTTAQAGAAGLSRGKVRGLVDRREGAAPR